MENSQTAHLLIRVAAKLPANDPDIVALVAVANSLLGSSGTETEHPARGDRAPEVTFPLAVFKVHKGRRLDARLLEDGGVIFGEKRYQSPSAAGVMVTGYNLNGWRFWQYQDPRTGRVRSIDDLRQRQLVRRDR